MVLLVVLLVVHLLVVRLVVLLVVVVGGCSQQSINFLPMQFSVPQTRLPLHSLSRSQSPSPSKHRLGGSQQVMLLSVGAQPTGKMVCQALIICKMSFHLKSSFANNMQTCHLFLQYGWPHVCNKHCPLLHTLLLHLLESWSRQWQFI